MTDSNNMIRVFIEKKFLTDYKLNRRKQLFLLLSTLSASHMFCFKKHSHRLSKQCFCFLSEVPVNILRYENCSKCFKEIDINEFQFFFVVVVVAVAAVAIACKNKNNVPVILIGRSLNNKIKLRTLQVKNRRKVF